MPDSTYRGEATLSLLQEEEGAGPGAAVAHLDQRGPTARHGAPRLGRRGGAAPPSSSRASASSTTAPPTSQRPRVSPVL